jgi:hypothetical protein
MLNTITGLLGGGVAGGDYESIATVTVGGGGQASISFTSIPSTYTHLQVRYLGRSDSNNIGLLMQFNSDTAANYSSHYLNGNGTAAGAGASTSTSTPLMGLVTAASYGASRFGTGVVDILDYKDANKYKTARALSGVDDNGAGALGLYSASWRNTAAITSIQFTIQGSQNFAQYSSFALYGIK